MSSAESRSGKGTTPRVLVMLTPGVQTSDGAGVRLTRIIGSADLNMIDPFLLLDCFESDNPNDYIAGFPNHPHRGFETVTYLLAGRMRHKDNAGHEGVIEPGGVQWMTAGRGIVHSEMPEQENGLLKGFQLWVNLPAAEKMSAPGYQEFDASQIPVETLEHGGTVTVIAGKTDRGTVGPAHRPSTDPLYFDVELPDGGAFEQLIPPSHHAVLYTIGGSARVGAQRKAVPPGTLGVLSDGDHVRITADNDSARFLLIAGRRLNEPVARGGPFVMNTRQEVMQAFRDFKNNRFQE